MKRILFFVLLLNIFACFSAKEASVSDQKTPEDIAASLFGDRYKIDYNNENTFSIIQTKYKTLKDLFPTLDFVVYDHKAQEVVLRDTLKAGSVTWVGDHRVKAIARNLAEDGDDENKESKKIYFYDVQERKRKAVPPPPPPIEEPPGTFLAEQMPRYPGCEDLRDDQAKDKCAQEKLLTFIYENLKYPATAKSKKTEGTVIVRFTIDKEKGEVKDAEVLRTLGDGCDEEALRVINKMPNWIPGMQRGKNVSVYFNLPIKFRL